MQGVESVNLESKECPLGCLSGDDILFTAQDRIQKLPGVFTLRKCKSCGLVRTDPRPTQDTIGFYYPVHYAPYIGSRIDRRIGNKSLIRRGAGKLFHKIFKFNCNTLPQLRPGRMLELGCASGSYLAEMSALGWEVQGIEFSEHAGKAAIDAGFDVKIGSVESIDDCGGDFDLIVGWMVVEHLHDPVGVLKKLASWTKHDGYLAISVPNIESLDFMLFKEYGYALQLPTHLYHFSPRTITELLAKSGWHVERILHQRVLNNYFGSIGLKLNEIGAPAWLVQFFMGFTRAGQGIALAFYPLAYLLSIFGQTGRMTVWARKITN